MIFSAAGREAGLATVIGMVSSFLCERMAVRRWEGEAPAEPNRIVHTLPSRLSF
jgi:hypothetical protein